MYKLISVISDIVGGVERVGTTDRGEIRMRCPNPHCHSHTKQKWKMQLNVHSEAWQCWTCHLSGRGAFKLMCKYTDVSNIINGFGDVFSKFRKPTSIEQLKAKLTPKVNVTKTIQFPDHTYPLSLVPKQMGDDMRRYMLGRGITPDQWQRYSIHGCIGGEYSGRVLFPSFDCDMNMTGVVARAIYPSIFPTFIEYGNTTLYFESLISWEFPVVLVESHIDAITLRHNTIPIGGTALTPKTLNAITNGKPPKVIVCLDPEASMEARVVAEKLLHRGIATSLVQLPKVKNKQGKYIDINELGYEKSWQYINNAKPITTSDILKSKILSA